MQREYPLVHLASVAPLRRPANGWDGRTDLRIGVSQAEGSSSLAYRAVVPPGASRARHVNRNCDEILIYLRGEGVAGQGAARAQVRAGHCQWVPRGCEHFFHNGSKSEDAVIVGFYPGAGALSAIGFEAGAPLAAGELRAGQSAVTVGALVHLDDVAPARMSKDLGWSITDFRLPIGRHNGASSTLFRARFFPGAVHRKHRHDRCEEIYFLISGSGIAGAGRDRVRVEGGDFHFIPKGVEHWLSNLSAREPIEVVGIYIGAGSVEETAYVYLGDVTAGDLVLSE